ncbi:MAG: ABC transporter ATP-binding protein [Gammaproteobacteria bacterium]|nr:ABC transporter ATP-binding protein [Gammaproteobacteria bacterium]
MAEPIQSQSRKKTLREREAELDARSSGLDTRTDIGAGEALGIIFRATKYIGLFWGRYLAKFILKLGSYSIPLFLLPWPLKVLTDHVVLRIPVSEASGFPSYAMPFVSALEFASPIEIVIWFAVIGLFFVVFIGSYTQGFEDEVDAGLAQGHDYATQVENHMHGGHSTAGGLYGWAEFKLHMRLNQSLNHTLRSNLFARITSLSMTKLEEQRIGDSIYRVMYDTPQINEIFYEITHTPIMSTILFMQAYFMLISAYPHLPEIAILTVLIFPAWVLVSSLFGRIVRRRGQAARAAGSITTATIEEGMDNVLAVQSLGGNKEEKGRFDNDSKESFFRYRRVTFLWYIIFFCSGIMGKAASLAPTAYFVFRVIHGDLTPGDVVALGLIMGYLRGPAFALGWLWIRFMDNVVAMRRVFAFMDMEPEADMGNVKLGKISKGIEMKRVGLVYPDGRRALNRIDLEANIGEIVAFVGPTGAGKTSLAYLIPRYHMSTEGEVLIDKKNVDHLTLDSLRSQVTYVFQETQLFSETIRDNICYGKLDAPQAEVERVAKIAGIHDFIESLPEGYQTKLGATTASRLSVGQKQRIAIARGLIRDSRILILDEPTSALDPETEEHLVNSLHEAAKDRLVIIIAHRLSTIAQSDKIVFLENGSIVEQGSHEELLNRPGGAYRRFVELQTTGAAEGGAAS